ncbi:AGC family protein kinase [Trichomonas vaginalis G3]|uniref:AGC family protein kinase n=1 Tax=Trichomonas vaginalis (strain ATCC PRA-98 / G3) TaxID=412133 RepID=A2ER29_TRIV3|nr:regulation of centriole replication [Trichomonas vaginalis G3]EAY04919.1 AGC family protein kinase [Trichomonas vaginalis G3]KAI5519423.1 regulation of centriole replication [Trichomonas vaginalis G3]|eukprot:XP_001317142.1 AGC family protein kinase [Trichomonas vaginalis G3]
MDAPYIDVEAARIALEKRGYILIDIIGYGGFANVFKVYSQHFKQYFAAKVCYIGSDAVTQNLQSFMAEVGALSKIYHSSVINIYSYFDDNSYLFIILDYCPNGSVLDYIKTHPHIETSLIFDWLVQTTEGLVACHNIGISHRDIKPSNLLIDSYNRIKIGDFGLAVIAEKSQMIARFGGSPIFYSPEMVMKKKFDPFKADVWALGITFYRLIFGKIPYTAKSNDELVEQIKCGRIIIPATCDAKLSVVLEMILKPNPDERPTAADVLQLLKYIRPQKKAQFLVPFAVRRSSNKFKSQTLESKTFSHKLPTLSRRRNSAFVDDN